MASCLTFRIPPHQRARYFTRYALLRTGGVFLLVLAFVAGKCDLAQTRTSAAIVASRPAPSTAIEPSSPKVDFTDWSAVRIKAYSEALEANFPKPMAVVQISRLRVNAPLYEGVDDLTLDRGLGRIPGTALPQQDGNLAIAGHRDGFFRALKDIRSGDTIEVVTPAETATYIVERTTVVDPSDIEVLKPRSRSALTLITCYPFYFIGHAPQRFIVEAVLTQRSSSQQAISIPSPDAMIAKQAVRH